MKIFKDGRIEYLSALNERFGDLCKRVISSLVLLPATGLLIWIGGLAFDIGILIVASCMLWEWGGLIASPFDRYRTRLILAVVMLVCFLMALAFCFPAGMVCALLFASILTLFAKHLRIVEQIWLGVAIIMTIIPTLGIVWMRSYIEFGLETVIYVITSVVATDIGAYVSGSIIGGPKLLPKVSPSKTWAGLGGGIASSMLIATIFTIVLEEARIPALVPIAICITLVAQIGDLLESAIKRHFNVKDSGTLIPGHGGVLDRVDGMMTVLPMVTFAIWISGRSVLKW
ncbi:cytidylyltransferase family protein [Candidatus Endolissoclinum faulkneri L2]|uniref:Phosphatidate cytidylyltransferase n=1 Tax=Candidatus Endolissoclinum faulkneri L2 TaxID=1193729 RepID=K7ZCY6_9PROT|nr:phosphatidate cytidylyltransferase [Candidatus Endolissoclinum faulkneri]AFX99001.1 cytidylyltransferase family protein [Candidatus Endolissoclinum faulkneri L2]